MVISLYFHLPFCKRKCPYCHFYVVPNRDQSSFLEALLTEWELRLFQIEGKEIASLYFGGGTPTLCVEGIKRILEKVKAPEITVEANPEDVTPKLMKTLHDLGVNRISLGVQSLNNTLLKRLGREHTAQKALDAVDITCQTGIKNITIDLMYEVPYQTFKMWEETIKVAADLPITHLSLYNLTIEPHTSFKKREKDLIPHLPDEETATKMLQYACSYLEKAHFKRYEISAFARDDKVSIHNRGYWTGREFLGYGPSAFSYYQGKRFQNVCHFNRYIKMLEQKMLPTGFEEKLPFPSNLHEKIAIGLRLTEGIPLRNIPLATQTLLIDLNQEGWIHYQNNHVTLTDQGRLFYDTVAEKIIDA